MMKKHISILLSTLLIISSGFTAIYAEGETSPSPTIEATQQPEPTETPEVSTDDVETEEPDTNVEVGEESSSENESEDVTEPSATETPEVTPVPEINEDTSEDEEELDPSVSYALQYADGTSAEDVISSEELSTDKAIQRITLNTENIEPSMVTYNVYLSNYGWSDEKHGGEVAGKDDGSNIEGFYAKLDDSLKEMYSIGLFVERILLRIRALFPWLILTISQYPPIQNQVNIFGKTANQIECLRKTGAAFEGNSVLPVAAVEQII